MSLRTQIICLWSIPAFILCYAPTFIFVAEFVPPPSPSLSAEALAALFEQNRMGIRVGQLLCMIFSLLYLPWCAVVSVQMARIEGRYPVLSVLQIAGASLLMLLFMLCSLIWITAAFRPEQDPANLQMMNDFAWLIFVMAYPEYWIQLFAIAIVFLWDKRPVPFVPRWACFYTMFVAFGGAGGSFAGFFKSGPWAWDGILGFWTPVILFLSWLIVMFPLFLQGVRRQADLDALSEGQAVQA